MGKRPKGDLELYAYIGNQIKKARKDNDPARLDGQKSPSAMTQTALGNVFMCSDCLDKFNERLFYGEEK